MFKLKKTSKPNNYCLCKVIIFLGFLLKNFCFRPILAKKTPVLKPSCLLVFKLKNVKNCCLFGKVKKTVEL